MNIGGELFPQGGGKYLHLHTKLLWNASEAVCIYDSNLFIQESESAADTGTGVLGDQKHLPMGWEGEEILFC